MKKRLWNGLEPKDVPIITPNGAKIKDLTGKKFNSLTVMGYVGKTSDGHSAWKCLCDCGNYAIVAGNDLTRKNHPTKSCGCKRVENAMQLANQNVIDMTGQKFGVLTVLKRSEEQKGHGIWWDCIDEQNNVYSIRGDALRSGHNSGLLNKSKGEFLIAEFLKDNNIIYTPQYRFPDCKDINPLAFDFAIWNQDKIVLIEYDGIQHFCSGGSDWNTNDHLEYTQKHDMIKNDYCKDKHIPLLRIKYDDNVILKLTTFLKENNII